MAAPLLLPECEAALGAAGASEAAVRQELKATYDAGRTALKVWRSRGLENLPRPGPELLVDVDSETIWQQLQSHSTAVERWVRAAEVWFQDKGRPALERAASATSDDAQRDEADTEAVEEAEAEREDEDDGADDGDDALVELKEEDDDEDEEEDEGKEEEEDDGKPKVGEDRFFKMDEMEAFLEGEEDDEDGEEDEEDEENEEKKDDEANEKAAESTARARALERENLKTVEERGWELRGEVEAKDRPMNSLLGVDFAFDSTRLRRPETTPAEMTAEIEALIKERVRENRFDDLVAADLQAKAHAGGKAKDQDEDEDPAKLGEKSQRGLADEYERDFLGGGDPQEEARDEGVDRLWERLAGKLDALSHFASVTTTASRKRTLADLEKAAKAANAPAVSLEEATPGAVAAAETRAPQEVHAKARGKAGLLQSADEATRDERRAKRNAKKRARNATRRKLRADARVLSTLNPALKNPYERDNLVRSLRGAAEEGPASSSSDKAVFTAGGSTALFEQLTREAHDAVHGKRASPQQQQQREQQPAAKKKRRSSPGAALKL